MNMDSPTNTITRRDFIKSFPKQLLATLQGTLNACWDIVTSREDFEKERQTRIQQFEAPGPCVARIDVGRCLAWQGMSCQLCYLACPIRDKAIETRDQKPVIVSAFCDGCGMCATACKTVNDLLAIQMVSVS